MKTLFVTFLLGFFLINYSLQAQSVKLKAILDATEKHETQEEFTGYLKQFDFCLGTKSGREVVAFYPHFKCGRTEIGKKGLRVNFSISNDGSLNSSFLTKNKNFVKRYKGELKKYGFVEISLPTSEEPRENALWYASKEYVGLHILWEYFIDKNNNKVWHIGFVWNILDTK